MIHFKNIHTWKFSVKCMSAATEPEFEPEIIIMLLSLREMMLLGVKLLLKTTESFNNNVEFDRRIKLISKVSVNEPILIWICLLE